jgi:hypothetical protein
MPAHNQARGDALVYARHSPELVSDWKVDESVEFLNAEPAARTLSGTDVGTTRRRPGRRADSLRSDAPPSLRPQRLQDAPYNFRRGICLRLLALVSCLATSYHFVPGVRVQAVSVANLILFPYDLRESSLESASEFLP